jgi:hypothetical protein
VRQTDPSALLWTKAWGWAASDSSGWLQDMLLLLLLLKSEKMSLLLLPFLLCAR